MARSTQYIGLTNKAKDWLSQNGFIEVPNPEQNSLGMFDEHIPLGMWKGKLRGRKVIIKEICQEIPWSSGPMIFTNLVIYLFNPDESEVKLGSIFEWVHDPDVKGEYNPSAGTFWI
jgi:hypothetical protein